MRKIALFNLLIIFSSQIVAQKLTRSEIDEFTGQQIVETSEVWLYNNIMADAIFVSFGRVDQTHFMEVRVFWSDVFSVSEGEDKLMLKLQDGTILKFPCIEYEIANALSTHVWELRTRMPMTKSQIQKIKDTPIIKARFYTNDGFLEDDVSLNKHKKIKKAIHLIGG